MESISHILQACLENAKFNQALHKQNNAVVVKPWEVLESMFANGSVKWPPSRQITCARSFVNGYDENQLHTQRTGRLEGCVMHLFFPTYTQRRTEQIRLNIYMETSCRGHKYGATAGSPRGRERSSHSELFTLSTLINPPPDRSMVLGKP